MGTILLAWILSFGMSVSATARAINAPPKQSVTFNPIGVIPLPDAASGDVTVLTMKVPIGYDGIITGQFNVYTQGFAEGSGDLIWRVLVYDPSLPRYLKDCGQIIVTLGQVNKYQTIPGGLLVRSNNTVVYVCNAPNVTGGLPPAGTGSIICGIHGHLWPRRS